MSLLAAAPAATLAAAPPATAARGKAYIDAYVAGAVQFIDAWNATRPPR